MLARAAGIVERIEAEREGAQELLVRVGDELRPAINYAQLTGMVAVGDAVLLNAWAVSLGLGSGGFDFVVAARHDEARSAPPGHIMKLRYTPMQVPVLAAEAQESPHHEAVRGFQSLDGAPVVCAELHSQLGAIAAAAKWETNGAARVAYVMTDGGALPIAHSRTVAELRARGLVDATITAGQAFGGELEAINLYSALAVARVVAKADVIIVSQGPGSAGTATQLGFSGLDQGIALNAAASLGGTPIAVVRLSEADPRPRHAGLSHHTVTVLDRVALVKVFVPVPRLPPSQWARLRENLDETGVSDAHELVTVDADIALHALEEQGVPASTMGRGLKEERSFFLAAVAAGLFAGQWARCAEGRSGPEELS